MKICVFLDNRKMEGLNIEITKTNALRINDG